jgi:hypothetical protein
MRRAVAILMSISWLLMTAVTKAEVLPSPSPSSGPEGAAAPSRPVPVKTQKAWRAQIIRKNVKEVRKGPSVPGLSSGISGMAILNPNLSVNLAPTGEKLRPFVIIQGKYDRPQWRLFVNKVELSRDPATGAFSFYMVPVFDGSWVGLTALGPEGEQEKEIIMIQAPEAREIRLLQPSRYGELTFFLGVSWNSYFQTGFGDFSSRTCQAEISYKTPEWHLPVGLLADVRGVIFTMSSTPKDLGPQFLNGSLDVSYAIAPYFRRPLRVMLMGGVKGLMMISNGSPFGFSSLLAPEIGAGIEDNWLWSSTLRFDGRFISLSKGFIDFGQKGLDFGLSLSRPIHDSHRITLGLRFSDYDYLPESACRIRIGGFSVLVGYSP